MRDVWTLKVLILYLHCFILSHVSHGRPRQTGGQKGLSIFHKKYEQHNKRHRQGYADDLGMRLSRVAKVSLGNRARDAFNTTNCRAMHWCAVMPATAESYEFR